MNEVGLGPRPPRTCSRLRFYSSRVQRVDADAALAEQVAMSETFTADFSVVRALLRKGRGYEQAVKLFEPYRETQEPDELTRAALADIARRSMREKRRAYAYVNNRLEGNAPSTIEAVAGLLGSSE